MSGRAFMFVTPDDVKFLAGIEKLIGTTLPEIALDGFTVDATPDEAPQPKVSSARSRRPAARSPREAPPAPAAPPARATRPEPRTRRSSEPPRRWRQEDDQEELDSVVGFGANIPAFLQTPPRIRRG
jgi:hypothetical protein